MTELKRETEAERKAIGNFLSEWRAWAMAAGRKQATARELMTLAAAVDGLPVKLSRETTGALIALGRFLARLERRPGKTIAGNDQATGEPRLFAVWRTPWRIGGRWAWAVSDESHFLAATDPGER